MHTLVLRRGKSESLSRRHPWIFSGALKPLPDDLKEGEVVRVVSSDGEYLATGHWQIGSIAVRVLSFDDEAIDYAFWHRCLSAAVGLRRTLRLFGESANTACRLVHGEGDGLPGLVIDLYGATAVVQAHSIGMHYARHDIARALTEMDGLYINNVYYKSATTLPEKAVIDGEREGFLVKTADVEDVAVENGLRFRIDYLGGQKTGFFVDQRDNRRLVEKYAHGRRVLNMFCYTGGFSVYALRGGARHVTSVDSSEAAVALVRENVALNFPEAQNHEAVACDAFRYLADNGKDYDLIILDPPAFAKRVSALKNALKGYTRLNAAAMAQLPPGGLLFTFSCSQAVSPHDFRLAVFTAAARTGRRVRILHQLHQPADHPISIYHPEGEYLKGLVLEVE
ncbi:MAG: class I SAM-dependent rRNA methyltransferase [Alloprevotella sp.]|nr:class I SAM-dependent rRNA methyltransferase [Alloprevotella sp.]